VTEQRAGNRPEIQSYEKQKKQWKGEREEESAALGDRTKGFLVKCVGIKRGKKWNVSQGGIERERIPRKLKWGGGCNGDLLRGGVKTPGNRNR